ncbi:PepSY-associated TM helix domain-containing protein [Coraliomargarita akajimensis]|uniref:PepSY-associated TM helix domain protein n=1 Tax=Coraliomargarita akajimensis (strain DSM 45221 / IAM 15411 / JCM 23193 / KCTC 12865 / 04OKA010-24) TaxID=583355 RepID=D5EK97_CORAD|nr:PepSY-associated TM helix domain-containing protein [Coraliomargarita akajimensis]ADE54846.1 PepSY-associated TM helix domain protein [Coraliomargarita akajimensis DSM 45221]
MKIPFPRKRTLLAWHRWMGIGSAVFLLAVSVTGLALNHTERLGLDNIHIRSEWILKRYGMESGNSIQSFRIHSSDTISYFSGHLYYNSDKLCEGTPPVGLWEGSPISALATEGQLVMITSQGELIETLSIEGLTGLATDKSGAAILITADGALRADSNWVEFKPFSSSYTVTPLQAVELDSIAQNAILESFQGSGVPLYRVILDLHSGRLFGWGGRTLMDLTAIAVILLVTSGLAGWLRKSRRAKPVRHL